MRSCERCGLHGDKAIDLGGIPEFQLRQWRQHAKDVLESVDTQLSQRDDHVRSKDSMLSKIQAKAADIQYSQRTVEDLRSQADILLKDGNDWYKKILFQLHNEGTPVLILCVLGLGRAVLQNSRKPVRLLLYHELKERVETLSNPSFQRLVREFDQWMIDGSLYTRKSSEMNTQRLTPGGIDSIEGTALQSEFSF